MPVLDITVNATRILQEIWMNPGVSRIDLSRLLNLNKSTITKIVYTLLEEGLIVLAEDSYVTDGKGRRPTGLYINDELGVVLGIEIQTDSWNAVAVNLRGETLDAFTSRKLEPENDLTAAIDKALQFCSTDQIQKGRAILGAGIGVSGQVNPYESIVVSSNPLKVYEPLDIIKTFKDRYPFPMVIENDANCCCWNVIMEKRSKRDRNFLSVLGEFRRIGMGPEDGYSEIEGIAVGLGLVIKDSVLHGQDYSAGEFQSVFKVKDNPSQFNIALEQIADLRTDRKLWESVMRELAKNLALLVNVLNISYIKVFGDVAIDPDFLRQTIGDEIESNWLYANQAGCTVEVAQNDTLAVATGAAAFFLNRIYSIPDIHDEYVSRFPFGIELMRMALQNSLST